MATPDTTPGSLLPRDQRGPSAEPAAGEYVVVARRYRPQVFGELVGQQHVARALSNAITSNRVGHAYLFTGARGVGKTSSARILAKALNCEKGPTPTPCNECDICQGISAGSDVDVLEIDGASNRGIDEIRQLRQNVNIRPSRARFKIYIIDEVHMLTTPAFNALLKTLEEPPEHVKFIFCTTEANKIPITILSRCQRFDFAGIRAPSIVERLRQIVADEGVEAEDEALEILARRANGSMRDSQSLLEQFLSFGGKTLRAADVHALLGTAAESRLAGLVEHLIHRDAAAALADLDGAVTEGVDVGQLLEQLLGMFRDCMAAAVGCPAENMLFTSAGGIEQLADASRRLGLETILAIVQILDQTLSRMRYSTQGRTLAEMVIVRICTLEQLDELPQLIESLRTGAPISPPTLDPRSSAVPRPAGPAPSYSGSFAGREAKKKLEVEVAAAEVHRSNAPVADAPGSPRGEQAAAPATNVNGHSHEDDRIVLSAENAGAVWQAALANLSDLLADNASLASGVANSGPNRLAISFPAKYTACKNFCERPDQVVKLERALSEAAGGTVKAEFVLLPGEPVEAKPAGLPARSATKDRQKLAEKSDHPLVRRATELFGARVARIDESGSV